MSTIGKNIRKIRTVKKLSQASFAELFNLARPSVGAYEEGRAEPKIDTVIQIANHFGISTDSLLTKELTINELYKFDLHTQEVIKPNEAKADQYENIKSVFVPSSQYFEYIVQYNNKDFISGLPKILIPGFQNENMRAFEMNSEEMQDQSRGINNGDILLARKTEISSKTLKKDFVYVFVTKKEILIRRLNAGGNKLSLKADNLNFDLRIITFDDILEIWEGTGYFSKNIKAPTLISDRIMSLEGSLEKLTERLDKLEKKSGHS